MLVLVFDICSSTSILEDLKQNDSEHVWRKVLSSLNDFLASESTKLGFEVYKFIGDGWILLFPYEGDEAISGDEFLQFLGTLCKRYDRDSGVLAKHLQTRPERLGLTLGVDSGLLMKVRMNGRGEYVGRALNVATRLQAATKDLSEAPGYTILFSKHSYSSLQPETPVPVTHKVTLRNINNEHPVECVALARKGHGRFDFIPANEPKPRHPSVNVRKTRDIEPGARAPVTDVHPSGRSYKNNNGVDWALVRGEADSDGRSEASWIDLDTRRNFKRGELLRLYLGGAITRKRKPARKVLVRFLAKGDKASHEAIILRPEGYSVPGNGVVDIPLEKSYRSIRCISVHGGETPWGYPMGKGNGTRKLEKVEVLKPSHVET